MYIMAKTVCIPVDEQQGKEHDAYIKLAEEFWKIPAVRQLGNQSIGLWKTMVHTATRGEIPEDGIPRAEQLKIMRKIMDRDVKKLSKTRGGLAKALYLPDELYGDMPSTKKWFESVTAAASDYKGNTEYFNSQLRDIYTLLREASYKEGSKPFLERFSAKAKPKAQKKIEALYKQYNKLKRAGKYIEADQMYTDKIVSFLKEGEGQIFADFHTLASATKADWANLKKTGGPVVAAAAIWREKIQPHGQKMMIQGLYHYRNGLKSASNRLSDFTKYEPTLNVLDSIIKRYESGELQKDGYFPVLALDVMPSLAEATKFLFHGKGEADFNKGAGIVSELENVLNKNIYTNRHLKETSDTNDRISYNVIPIMDSFARSATRFNFVAYNTNRYIEAIKDLEAIMRNDGSGPLDAKLTAMQGLMSDTYSMITGEKTQSDSSAANFTRAITAWQFVSKLGLNIRGAARNATQSLLNWVWFGKKGMSEVGLMMKNQDMKQRVDAGLSDNGILFPQIQEIYFEDFAPKVGYNESTRTYQEKLDLSVSDHLVDKMTKIAAKLGRPMQWVENQINRRYTYQLGYALQWKGDQNRLGGLYKKFDRAETRKLKREGKGQTLEGLKEIEATIFKKGDSNEYERRFEEFRRLRANRSGNAAVKDLHFDYAMTAKSKVLTTKVGSVLGQFQHYGINFYNLQRKIIRDGKDDVFSSQWNGDAAWRMYRLGLLYSTIYGLFSPMLNADIGNLIQNDTLERIASYHDAVQSDDPEAQKRAFHGKGVVLGSVGGPFIADMTTVGNLTGLYEMDEDGFLAYLMGYQDMADLSGSDKMRELVRTLNVQMARTLYTTIPKWRSGAQIGTLIQGELGLFPTKEVRKQRETLGIAEAKRPKRKASPTSDEAVLRSLDLLRT